jgi:hypothetical protein
MRRLLSCAFILGLIVIFIAGRTAAADVPADTSTDGLHELLTSLVLSHIPHNYENTKHWGQTDERWDGLHLQLDHLKLKTKRRVKEVNHGTWKMYRIDLIDPQNQFHVRVENTHEVPGGVGFDVIFTARLHLFGRMSKWVKGVQLFSISADGEAQVALRVACELKMGMDISKLPPDVLLSPQVTDADLQLIEFRILRISDVGGSVAKELGDSLRGVVEHELEDKRGKLVEKINQQIDKNRDKLRLSLHDLVASKWSDLTKYVPQN